MDQERTPRQRTPAEERDALLAYAFRALAGRALTASELRDKLLRRCRDESLVQEVLRRVQELGYQDDVQVARAEGSRRTVGTYRVKQTLKRRGVTETLIQDTLDARDPAQELEAAQDLLRRRWIALARKRDPRASAYAFLARRGFPGAVIWPAIREVMAGVDAELAEAPDLPDDPELLDDPSDVQD